MWTRIVGGLVLLIVASFAIQWVVPRSARGGRLSARQYILWDIMPIIGFFGALLLILSLVEAERQGQILAWGWGGGLGFMLGVAIWLVRPYAWRPLPNAKREPVWRVAWRLVRTLGPIVVVLLVVLNLLTRWMGSIVEVFAAGTFGVFVVVMAILFFVEILRRSPSVGMNEQRERNGK